MLIPLLQHVPWGIITVHPERQSCNTKPFGHGSPTVTKNRVCMHPRFEGWYDGILLWKESCRERLYQMFYINDNDLLWMWEGCGIWYRANSLSKELKLLASWCSDTWSSISLQTTQPSMPSMTRVSIFHARAKRVPSLVNQRSGIHIERSLRRAGS